MKLWSYHPITRCHNIDQNNGDLLLGVPIANHINQAWNKLAENLFSYDPDQTRDACTSRRNAYWCATKSYIYVFTPCLHFQDGFKSNQVLYLFSLHGNNYLHLLLCVSLDYVSSRLGEVQTWLIAVQVKSLILHTRVICGWIHDKCELNRAGEGQNHLQHNK